jgi:4-aminobutyrate aminotransferase/(S)-3-amino-2-methylpropionate transaminase
MPALLQSSVTTAVPGPLSQRACEKLDKVFDARAIHFVVDYDKSSGT